MKEFFGKLLFVLAIVGLIAAGNLLFPNPDNDKLTEKVSIETEASQEEPAE